MPQGVAVVPPIAATATFQEPARAGGALQRTVPDFFACGATRPAHAKVVRKELCGESYWTLTRPGESRPLTQCSPGTVDGQASGRNCLEGPSGERR
jgi:hypothetical protein